MADDRSPYLSLIYRALKLAARPLIAALAIVYFLLDALVLSFVHPLAKHLGGLRVSGSPSKSGSLGLIRHSGCS